MSTRSGKKYHNSFEFHENIIKVGAENAAKSERNTRSKRVKENLEETTSVFKTKKRYTTRHGKVDHKEDEGKTRSRKNALKERNSIATSNIKSSEQKKSVRTTRRTRKITETTEEIQEAPRRFQTRPESEISRISITSDDSKDNMDNIVNTTPYLIESSFDESHIVLKTPIKSPRRVSLPSPGRTPFPYKTTQERVLNITRSIEKRRSSIADSAPRTSKVMFCSPVNNPAVVVQQRRKVIRSNLKGSNKIYLLLNPDNPRSFVFDDSAIEPRPARKRSYSQSDAEDLKTKRKRLASDPHHTSTDRLSRSRTSSASELKEKPKPHPSSDKPKQQPSSEKPNRQPSSEKTNPQPSSEKPLASSSKKQTKEQSKQQVTPIKSLPSLKSLNPGYTRFGFHLNLDVNPFTFTTKTDAVKSKEKRPNLSRQVSVPSLTGATSLRREEAKKAIMREKSFTDKRNVNRNENRTIIKGVRTNRRFELQMRMRNMYKMCEGETFFTKLK